MNKLCPIGEGPYECFILNKANPKISDFKISEISFIELYEKGYVLDNSTSALESSMKTVLL